MRTVSVRVLGVIQQLSLVPPGDAPQTPALMSWVIKVILISSEKGDYTPLDSILNRLIGKVTDKLETKNTHEHSLKALPDSDLIEEAKVAIAFLSGKEA